MVPSIMRRSIFPLYIVVASCATTQNRQGIKGQVLWVSGNQLPGPGVNRSAHAGVKRELYIYEITTLSQVDQNNEGFYEHIQTPLIATVTTRSDGSFKLKLPPGVYSIFVKEEGGLFANIFDKNNAINPITVKEKQYTWVPITVDYQAAY